MNFLVTKLYFRHEKFICLSQSTIFVINNYDFPRQIIPSSQKIIVIVMTPTSTRFTVIFCNKDLSLSLKVTLIVMNIVLCHEKYDFL